MKRSSTSVAKLFLILSIVIATASVFKGLEWQRSAKSLATQLRSAQDSEEQSRKQAEELGKVLAGNEAALPLAPTVVRVVAVLTESQADNRVSIGPLTPGVTANGATVDLLELAQSVAGTELHALTIHVRGTYKEYAGLRRYLDQIQKHPVSLTKLSIVGNTFELNVKVFGTV